MRKLALLILCGVVLGAVGAAASPGDEADVAERLDFLEERLDASKTHGRVWQAGWMAVSTGGLIAGIVKAADESGEDQAVHIAEASLGAIGLTYMLLAPMEARKGADPIRAMPDGDPAEREAKLGAAEALLEENAERARERTDWKAHLGNIGVNLAVGAAVVGFGNLGDAAFLTFSGTVMGALQIWSAPSRPLEDWEEYQGLGVRGVTKGGKAWMLQPTARGAAFEMRF